MAGSPLTDFGDLSDPPLVARDLPAAVTRHLRALMDASDPADPIGRQFVPSSSEHWVGPGESQDPLDERRVEAAPRLLHRYPDRVLLLVTYRCAAYCRFCFRRESAGRRGGSISNRELLGAAEYVASHPEVREVILSGGDPLMVPGHRLAAILKAFAGPEPPAPGVAAGAVAGAASARKLAFRIHTRIPVVQPRRVTAALVQRLKTARPLRVVIQINHPRELSRQCLEAIAAFQAAGIPVLSQGVLLKGVNDDPRILSELWRGLEEAEVRPHYLFQPDLATGTAHFRVNLERALGIYREAVSRFARHDAAAGVGSAVAAACAGPGPAASLIPAAIPVPGFALDLPGGGGKVLLEECRIHRESSGFYRVEAPGGLSALYPVDEAPLDAL